ncbi:glycine betaine ABC transporter substrate-binding protein [Halogeometricum luteum]|uniref:Glycine/betaine ABC transporter substrate-binding protein n=1 Tax=Halogeometricum luteum TaxID=2950537 RepID=A0ABU2G602_9EURY|nr:glycine betaine ABC transporter substrate-binding protein [Halogeometricum sp. S3BR5-2]MDS0296223.1 glycine/betaine ABC transporter substrate-binding protein [Halogeometricum sp. S3BR5-2]
MTRTRRAFLKRGGAAAGIAATAGCTSVLGIESTNTVQVSSMRFTEDIILGYMALESLRENTDLSVLDETGLGGVTMNFRAVKNGEVTLYWLYSGGAWATIPPKHDRVIPDAEELYQAVKREFERVYDLEYLNRAPFNNTYVLIADPAWAERTGVQTMSDFASYVAEGNTDFTVVMGPEFQQRADGWPGLAKHYGFDQMRGNLNVRNVGSSLTYQIVGEGGAEVGMGFSTNPKIRQYGLTTLEDDERFFPIYNPAPLVNGEALEAMPEMREPLNAIGPTLDTETILRLNGLVSLQGRDPQNVAREYLRSEGLI